MAEDVDALLDHLDLARVDMMGYSMGARITAFFARAHSTHLQRAVFGGLGIHLVDGVGLPEGTAEALAACIRGSRQTLTREEVAAIRAAVLVAVGTEDRVAGSARELAALLPSGRAFDIPRRDH